MPKKIQFYDLKAKKSFMSDDYKIEVRNKRKFAVAKAPSGIMSWKILGMAK